MKKYAHIFSLFIISIAAASIVVAPAASAISASQWQAGRIIDDAIFTNKNDMSVGQIQQFLNSKVPSCDTQGTKLYNGQTRAAYGAAHGNPIPFTCLKDYYEVPKTAPGSTIPASNYGGQPIPGGAQSAAQLIWNAAQSYNISPKVLLITLQKEQGLVTDDWPLKKQYTYAMGAHCPDSTGCDQNYSGFSFQMMLSAQMFRGYLDNMQESWWPYRRPFQNNTIAYNPVGSCGSSSVYIASKATAALYTYTPYQPNQAALNAGYGSGDACSAYGNRNFWLYFNDWFGSSLDTSFQLVVADNGDTRQYVVYNNMRQLVPSPDVKKAWGLLDTPLTTVSAAYMTSLTEGPSLDVIFRINGGMDVYLADNGKRYQVGSQDMLTAFGLNGRVISSVPTGLGNTPGDGGGLSYSIRPEGSLAVYMVDGPNGSGKPVLRQYTDGNVLNAIEGTSAKVTDISSFLYGSLNQAIGSALGTTKIAYGGSEYQLISGQRMLQPIGVAPLYPGVATTISTQTYNRLKPTSGATALIRSATSPTVYLLDNGTKRQVSDPSILDAWTPAGQYVNVVNDGFVNLIPDASPMINSYVSAGSSSNKFVMNGGAKAPVPTGLATAYAANNKGVQNLSTTLEALYPDATAPTSFLKANNSPQMYVLDNAGTLHPIPSPAEALAWGAATSGVTSLSPEAINTFTKGSSVSVFVTDGTTQYVLSNGQKLTVDSATKTKWGLNGKTPQTYSDGTLDRLTSGGALGDTAKDAQGYYMMRDGHAYYTTDSNIAKVWSIDTATNDYAQLIHSLVDIRMLTRFVKSSTDETVYAVDSNKWYSLTQNYKDNFDIAHQPLATLDPSNAPSTPAAWNGVVVKTSGSWYVIDGGGKRTFNNDVILNFWTHNKSLSVTTVSAAFVDLLPTRGIVERAVKGSDPAVYAAENANKRWIQSSETYWNAYAPYAPVSDALLNAMPNGNNIP